MPGAANHRGSSKQDYATPCRRREADRARPIVARHQEDQSMSDPVNSPAHYNFGSIEVIDAIEDWGLGFHVDAVLVAGLLAYGLRYGWSH
jgi:hypothetical protein